MTSPRANTSWQDADPVSEPRAVFRFRVTWSSLSVPIGNSPAKNSFPRPRSPVIISAPGPPEAPTQALAQVTPAPTPAVGVHESPLSANAARWEMVIPKMERPVSKNAPVRPKLSAPALRSGRSSPPVAAPKESFFALGWRQILISAAAVGLATWVWLGTEAPSSQTAPPSSRAANWTRLPARAGAVRSRPIMVYEGAKDETDFRVELGWTPSPQGLGLVFRARDAANYYALRFSQAGSTEPAALAIERFAVITAMEGKHSRKIVILGKKDREIAARLEAAGAAYTLYVQGTPVDYWNDERLSGGTVGLYGDRNQPPAAQLLRFTFFKAGARPETVETSLP